MRCSVISLHVCGCERNHMRVMCVIHLSQGPLRLSELEACYLRFYGFPLRIHNYGFYSTREMLEAAKDMIRIQQGRLGSVLYLKTEAENYERSQNIMRPFMIPRPPVRPFSTPSRTGPIKPPSVSSHRPICNNSDIKVPTTTKSPGLFWKVRYWKFPETLC